MSKPEKKSEAANGKYNLPETALPPKLMSGVKNSLIRISRHLSANKKSNKTRLFFEHSEHSRHQFIQRRTLFS
jgi:hypothetical protein